MLYRWLTWCSRRALRWCYRDVSVVGTVPARGPVLLAVNHPNDLADICAVLASVPRRVTFVANVSAAEHPVVRWVYARMGVIPVHRVRDVRKARARGEDSAAANARAFASVRETLGAGGCVCVFPEGGVQHGPHLGALRNGLARMALDARDGGVRGVQVVPVGLTYEAPAALRSRVLLEVGEPIALDEWRPDPDRPAETQLTSRVAARLRRITRQAPTADSAQSLRALAELAAAQAARATAPAHGAGSAHAARATAPAHGEGSAHAARGSHRRYDATEPLPARPVPPLLVGTQRWQAIADDIYGPGLAPEAAADRRLDGVRALAVELDSLAAVAPRWRLLLAWSAGGSAPPASRAARALLGALAAPAAAVGWLSHAPAWALVERLAQRGAESPHDVMPRRIVPGVYVMTAWYLLLSGLLAGVLLVGTGWSALGVVVAVIAALLFLPAHGDLALRWRDARDDARLSRTLSRAVPDLADRLQRVLPTLAFQLPTHAEAVRMPVPPSPPAPPSV